jgi:hypothetical protein
MSNKKLMKILKKIEKLKKEIEVLKKFNGTVDDDFEKLICIVGDFLISSNNFIFDDLSEEEKLLLGEFLYNENSCLGFGVIIHNNGCKKCEKIEEVLKNWNLEKYVKEYMGIKFIPVKIKRDFCIKSIIKNKNKICKEREKKIKKLMFEIKNNLDKI